VNGPDSYEPALHPLNPDDIKDYYEKQQLIKDKPHEAGHLIPSHIKNKQTQKSNTPAKTAEDLNQTQLFK